MHVPIPVDNVRCALPAWGIADGEFTELDRGATAEVWKLACDRGTYVAKYAYDDRAHFETGLRAAEVAQNAGLRSAAPLRTSDGELTLMLEWPAGHWHPLTLIEWVEGTPLDSDAPGAEEEFARIHGTLQAALTDGIPVADGTDTFSYLDYIATPQQDLGDSGELQEIVGGVAERARRFQEETAMTVATAVWDGPEILIDSTGAPGLIDFGYCRPMPVLHSMANRSLHFGLEENDRTRRFAELYLKRFPLTDSEMAGFTLFRQVSIAIYCKYQAWRLVEAELLPEKRDAVRAYVDQHVRLLA